MTEAQILAATGLLAFVLVLPGLVGLIMTDGFAVALGNRQEISPAPEWANRAARAQRNMVDTLIPFLAIVIAVQMAGVSNENTQWGMLLFFAGRLTHAIVYIAGIPYIRTLAFLVSANGLVTVAGEILPVATPSTLLFG